MHEPNVLNSDSMETPRATTKSRKNEFPLQPQREVLTKRATDHWNNVVRLFRLIVSEKPQKRDTIKTERAFARIRSTPLAIRECFHARVVVARARVSLVCIAAAAALRGVLCAVERSPLLTYAVRHTYTRTYAHIGAGDRARAARVDVTRIL